MSTQNPTTSQAQAAPATGARATLMQDPESGPASMQTTSDEGALATTRVAVIGASGYTGAELLRLIVGHPYLELVAATSNSQAGIRLDKVHPHLRGAPDEVRALRFTPHDEIPFDEIDAAFLAVPHGRAEAVAADLVQRGIRVFDLSADFRLQDATAYETWYGREHSAPELLRQAAYGIAELHRERYADAPIVSGAGCIATSAILALAPLARANLIELDRIVVDSKIGSSAAGVSHNPGSHHADRQRAIRPYAMTSHRHTAEIQQELARAAGVSEGVSVSLTPHAVELVRGILSTCHVFLRPEHAGVTTRDLWKLYRDAYGDEPFIQLVNERQGVHRSPDPRLLVGTNLCAIGFERDPHSDRVVITSAIDNLTKGAAGAAIQNLNIALGYPETTGLSTVGLYPFA